jgi:succinylglutamic semialdehyde dehydrogenase
MRDHFIGGSWVSGEGEPFVAADPTNSESPFCSRYATENEVAQACSSAIDSHEGWSAEPFDRRAAVALLYSGLLEKRKESIARSISREVGKPLWEARTEVEAMIRKIPLSIEAYKSRTGIFEQELAGGGRTIVSHHAHGVVAVLGPFNFPGHLPNGHITPAILAGNSVVFKPSELTPGVGALMAECWTHAGLPNGVLNLVQGGRSTAELLLDNPGLAGVYFTGSASAGVAIHRKFAGRPEVILALEMGGNSPLVVLGGADPVESARLIAVSAFITSGQRCTCTRRLILTPEAEPVVEPLIAFARQIVVDLPDAEPAPFMGPLILKIAAERVLAAQQELAAHGAIILEEARPTNLGLPFLRPGIVDVTNVRNLPDVEIFGPFLQLIRVASLEEAIVKANATRFGLAAGLVGGTAEQFAQFRAKVRAGIINWNRPTTGASSSAPFGGIGLSGNHRPTASYAADYCAYPIASMSIGAPSAPRHPGMGGEGL